MPVVRDPVLAVADELKPDGPVMIGTMAVSFRELLV